MDEISREHKYKLNTAIISLSLECMKREDCHGCPFCQYTESGLPHCRLEAIPENWELIK